MDDAPGRPGQAENGAVLSIGELARATGVTAAALRVWETRHGFPTPVRLDGGHRRYSRSDLTAIVEVCRRREAGTRLDIAIRQVRAEANPPPRPSVFADIVALHPAHPPQRLRKRTLLSISRAIEDEVAATAQHGHLFAGFQNGRHFAAARDRWRDLARSAASAHVFADFTDLGDEQLDEGSGPGPVRVRVPPSAPMAQEWIVICDTPDLSVALLASDLPGQDRTPDAERAFDAIWTVAPHVVRDASRRCAEVAAAAGSRRATELLTGALALAPRAGHADVLTVERLLHRILRYLEDDPRA